MNSNSPSIFKKGDALSARYRMGILMGEKSNAFWSEMERHYQFLAPKMGLEVECFWPSTDKDMDAQLRRLFEMVESKFDVLIVNPMSNHNLVSGIFHAVQKGIPVIDVGEKTDQKLVEEAKPKYIPLKTVDFYLQGVLGARYIIDRLRPGGVKKVAIIEGRKGAAQSMKRSQGAADIFQQHPSVRLVKRESADFDLTKAKDLAEKMLEEEPEIKAFFCANDVMALGAVDTIHQIGRMNEIMVVGVDLIREAAESIKQGMLEASVAFSTASVAQVVLESAIQLLRGEEIPDQFRVESVVVNRENLSWYFSSLNKR